MSSLLSDDYEATEDADRGSESDDSEDGEGLRSHTNSGRPRNAKGKTVGQRNGESGRSVRDGSTSLHPSRGVASTSTPVVEDNVMPTPNVLQMPVPPGCFFVPVPQASCSQDMRNMISGLSQSNFPMNWNYPQANSQSNAPGLQGEGQNANDRVFESKSPSLKEESVKKRIRRASKRDADEAARKREAAGLKPYIVQVKPSGIIDSSCAGHLKWHEYIRNLTPRMLDMSVIKLEEQYEDSKIKLREALRKKFEFLDHEVTDAALDKMVKTWMRKDRERMKRRHFGKIKAPGRYSEKEWDSMKKYWGTPSSKEESEKMVEKRKKVAHNSRVGRLGYAGKAAKLVCTLPKLMHWWFTCMLNDL